LGEEAGEVVFDALDLLECSDVEVLCCLDVFLIGISFAVDGLSVGGIVAAWLLLDPCLLLEEAFFLILSSTSVNDHVLLAVYGVAALDAGCSSSSESSDPLASLSLSSLCLDVFVELFFLFLEEVSFVMLVFGEKRIAVKWSCVCLQLTTK